MCEHSMRDHSMCDHSMSDHSMCDHSMWALYVWPLYVSTLCVTTLCEHSMCEHSMWAHVWARCVPQKHHHKNTATPPQKHHLCEQHVWARCVGTLCVSSPKSAKITTKNEHQFLGRMLQNTEKYENYHEKWTSVLGPDVAEHRKVRKLPGKMNISSCAGCCRTPESTKITRKNEHQFLGRMLQRQKRQKSTSFIVKIPFKSIAEHRKVRELPRKMNIEEVEEPKKYENLQTKPVLDPFNRPSPQSTRITTKNEHRRSREAGNYENLQTKAAPVGRRHPKTTKIHRRNEHASTKPRK